MIDNDNDSSIFSGVSASVGSNDSTSGRGGMNNGSHDNEPTNPIPQNLNNNKKAHIKHNHTNDSSNTIDDGAIGEMQIKLDIADAKLLTEEMKYKDLMERFQTLQHQQETQISILQKELDVAKIEGRKQEQERANQIKNLEAELRISKQQQDNSPQSEENEGLKRVIEQQQDEMDELCSEIQRLHHNHKDDSDILNDRIKALEREKFDFTKREEAFHDEISTLQEQLQDHHRDSDVTRPKSEKDEHIKDVKNELNNIRSDFSKLAEETERLEKELEAVTEDRDELLRRSIHNVTPKSSPKSMEGKAIISSMADTSLVEYELQRIREALEGSESIRQKQELRICELEKLINSHVELESLDLSSIDIGNTNNISRDDQRELDLLNKEIVKAEKDKDELKECLAEAMQEIEKLEYERDEIKSQNEITLRNLKQVIEEKDEEIEKLHCSVRNNSGEDEHVIGLESSNIITSAKATLRGIQEAVQTSQNDNRTLRDHLQKAIVLIDSLISHSSTSSQGDKENNKKNEAEDFFGKMVQISSFDLSQKNDEIVELKVMVGQLRQQLKEIQSQQGNDKLREMPTPTKSNRSLKTAQSSNEQDDMKIQTAQSEIKKLQNDLKAKSDEEETLKTIIENTSSRLTEMTHQIETLTEDNEELLRALKESTEENVRLKEDIFNANATLKEQNESDNNNNLEEFMKLKTEFEVVTKERKKLEKSLTEAVNMLNALQEHVVTAEKECKKMKKQLKSVVSNQNSNKSTDFKQSHDDMASNIDPMESQTLILQLRSHIIALDHEISHLNSRIDELEALKNKNSNSHQNNLSTPKMDELKILEEKLIESQNAYEMTKAMLDEVSRVNKELLNDLKATERDEEATLEELEDLRARLHAAHNEIHRLRL